MQVKASTILSFVTGRLYSTIPPTILFGEMLSEVSGANAIEILRLPDFRQEYASKILQQCPKEFQKTCAEWQHTPDWQTRVELIDDAFGSIDISYCG